MAGVYGGQGLGGFPDCYRTLRKRADNTVSTLTVFLSYLHVVWMTAVASAVTVWLIYLVVTTLPVLPDGRLVLIKRGIPPGLGTWAQPGGFLEIDETVTEAARRETLEETGLIVEPGELVGLYTRLEAAVVVVAFEARVIGGEFRTSPETLEVASFEPATIPWDGIAFKTTYWAIVDWLARRHPEIAPGDPAVMRR